MNTTQNDNQTGSNSGDLFPNLPLKYLTASSIIGDKVLNENDDHLGEIKDIMLDIKAGKIDYLVIEFGGFLGIGVKYFAIPFRLLRVDPARKLFIFNQSKEALSGKILCLIHQVICFILQFIFKIIQAIHQFIPGFRSFGRCNQNADADTNQQRE
jgi:sporulation protein YlmC with PRC-barrel domain